MSAHSDLWIGCDEGLHLSSAPGHATGLADPKQSLKEQQSERTCTGLKASCKATVIKTDGPGINLNNTSTEQNRTESRKRHTPIL